MSILTEQLPDWVKVGEKKYFIDTDFTTAIKFETLISDRSINAEQKIALILNLFYKEEIPDNIQDAIEAVYQFYACGTGGKGTRQAVKAKRIYDFEHDADYIYSAFMADYGIDLQEYIQTGKTLHWWKFRAMFVSLNESNLFCKIMGWRSADLRSLKGEEKNFYRKMQKLYALPLPKSEQDKITEIDRILMNDGDLQKLRKGGIYGV